MKDFYFKVQINISSSVQTVTPEMIQSVLSYLFNDDMGILTDVEVEKISKKEYYG